MKAALPLERIDTPEFESHSTRTVLRWQQGALVSAIDQVAEEVPVAMIYNGISHVVMLATPTSLEQFGLGFSLSEGILHDSSELYDMEVVCRETGIELQMTISAERFAALKQKRRNLAGRTGCGLCGAESLQQVIQHSKPVESDISIATEAIHLALANLPDKQTLQAVTGAAHAAAWGLPDGTICCLEEDIGRHNALDKLIGSMSRRKVRPDQGFAMVTSRASYEMVQKASMAGIPILVAVSAPTGLAIEMAEKARLTLVGFARIGSHVIYTHPQRLK